MNDDGILIGKSQELIIRNLTSNAISQVTLTINGRWSASLGDLRTSISTSIDPAEGHTLIPPGNSIWIQSGKDVPNYLKFKDSTGRSLPKSVNFEKVVVHYDKGEESFDFN